MRYGFIVLCLFAAPAYAQYHAGVRDCDPYIKHQPSADIEARDGFDQHGNPIKSADMEPNTLSQQFENPKISLDIPVTNYVNENKYNADLSESRINLGEMDVQKDGTTSLNGVPIKQQNVYSTECK
ncbi:MAG: hypothetical protein J0M34_01995 [Alphaproteobacteria bacterium]|nr:hypothetical protein [Alphaproteobacteria bacterium]